MCDVTYHISAVMLHVMVCSICQAANVVYMMFSFHAGGVFTLEVWSLLSNLEDIELQRLAQALPATV